MTTHGAWAVESALADLVSGARAALRAGAEEGFHPLTAAQVDVLRRQGNTADDGDWAQILVRGGNATIAQIFNCSFGGPVKIGALHGTLDCGGGVTFPSGLRSSRIVDAVVLDGAAVHNTDVLARTVVCRGAAVVGCGIVSAPPASAPFTFGNGTVVSVGAEVGGRAVPIAAEMPFNTAVEVASHQGRTGPHRELRAAHEAQIAGYTSAVSCSHAVIGPGAQCLKCPTLTAALVGAAAVVVAATVEEATLCSSADEPVRVEHGAQVRRAALQWGACVTSMALVEDSMMCEHSRVERHGKLFGSVLGPNSSISEGECSGSLVGPFVGFHHQSLLIASFWPEGKGNVGYGANVGSNHTGRAPDQELWPGQGVFFGLGTSIKFPANYRAAPYSIVATGVVTLPQTLAMPFSLVNIPSTRVAELSPAINEVLPGWVWLDSAYTVLRSEQKYKSRDKAQRARIGHEVITPAVARDVHQARAALVAAEGTAKLRSSGGEAVYIDKQIPGLGKNFVTERARQRGVNAYTQCLRLFALRGVARRAAAGEVKGDLWSTSRGDDRWQLERSILVEEFGAGVPVEELVRAHRDAEAQLVDTALRGKAKDDVRGAKTIPDYGDTHTRAADDPVILRARAAVSKL